MGAELQAFAGLVVFFVTPWELPWNGHVNRRLRNSLGYLPRYTQAGFSGICCRGRERDLYLSPDHVSARVAALGPTSLLEGSPTGLNFLRIQDSNR